MSVGRGRCWRGLLEWWWPSQRPTSGADSRFQGGEAGAPVCPSEAGQWSGSAESVYPGQASEVFALDSQKNSWVHDCESTEAELAEFLACDLESTEADPLFREKLRAQLWALVEEGEILRRRDH